MKTLILLSLFGLGFGADSAPALRAAPTDDPWMTIAHDKRTPDGGKKKKDDEEKEEDCAGLTRLRGHFTS